jgi:hypothetical protein
MNIALVVIVVLAAVCVGLWVKMRGVPGVKSDVADIGSDAKKVADVAKDAVKKVP